MKRHEVSHLRSRMIAAESSNKNVRFGEVNLAIIYRIDGRNREATTLLVVEKTVEYSWLIEERQAQPVDRPIVTDKRRCVHISDETVVFNPFV